MAERNITLEELATWYTPRDALRVVQRAHSDIKVAGEVIHSRLIGGLIIAAAKSYSWNEGLPSGPQVIPNSNWSHISTKSGTWWDTGDIAFGIWIAHQGTKIARYYGIRFDRNGVDEIVAGLPERKPPAPRPTPEAMGNAGAVAIASLPDGHILKGDQQAEAKTLEPALKETRGSGADWFGPSQPVKTVDRGSRPAPKSGRPAKPFWEPMWAEVAAKIYVGELTPERQVDVESAMHQWLTDNGFEASERSVRDRAKSLMDSIVKKGQ